MYWHLEGFTQVRNCGQHCICQFLTCMLYKKITHNLYNNYWYLSHLSHKFVYFVLLLGLASAAGLQPALNPSSLIPHPSSLIPHPSSLILIPYPLSLCMLSLVSKTISEEFLAAVTTEQPVSHRRKSEVKVRISMNCPKPNLLATC